jgi:hydroxypyruvate isomerase
MLRFAANLTAMYQEYPFVERCAAAAQDGFKAAEYLFPYGHPACDLASPLKDHGLQQVLFNARRGHWDADERVLAHLPGREPEFRAGINRALEPYPSTSKAP